MGRHQLDERGTEGAPARLGHSLAYDSKRQRIVLFGGHTGATQLSDTWEWDGSNWTRVAPATSPKLRTGQQMVYDRRTERVVLFGGFSGKETLADTWAWDGTNWKDLTITPTPAARNYFGMAYDEIRDRIVLFGGGSDSGSRLGDTWEQYIPSSYTLFGAGCAGSATPPVLKALNTPQIGAQFTLEISNVNPGARGFMLVGDSNEIWNKVSLPLDLTFIGMPSCKLLVSWAIDLGITAGPGTSLRWGGAIPNNPALLGGDFYNQAWFLDAKANALGVSMSNGGKGIMGR